MRMKKRVVLIVVVALMAALFIGCAAKAPVMQGGKQVTLFVLSDRGIKDGMKEMERNDRNEMGEFLEEDLVSTLKHEGYNAVLIKNRSQNVQGSANYLVDVRIIDLRLVGRGARYWAGVTVGTSMLKNHYEVTGSGNKSILSYNDDDHTLRDWSDNAKELNGRFADKLNAKFVGKSR
jgi:hypothetical protein